MKCSLVDNGGKNTEKNYWIKCLLIVAIRVQWVQWASGQCWVMLGGPWRWYLSYEQS